MRETLGSPSASGDPLTKRFSTIWAELSAVGRAPDGGFNRFAWTPADRDLRQWFHGQAEARDLDVEQDRNGNLWAWWGRGPGAIVTGSHLDSVPNGGGFDGALGVVSAFLAIDLLRRTGVRPRRPLAVVNFADEEGARFGVACVGSRLLTGALDPEHARRLVDTEGITLEQAMRSANTDPTRLGSDPERLAMIEAFVELHIEQGRALAPLGSPLGVMTVIWPHGRWRYGLHGEPNHAGTTPLDDRHDPMIVFAAATLEARRVAGKLGGYATFGKVEVQPNGTNAIAGQVNAWLDARAPDPATLTQLVEKIAASARQVADDHGVSLHITQESITPEVSFGSALCQRVRRALGGVPELSTGAGHDAGILSAYVPTAMILVRNPTGVSHSPVEAAELEDALTGIRGLAAALKDLVCH